MKHYLLILLIALFAFSSANAEEGEKHKESSIRLGVTIPLTGDYASYGQRIKDGVELAKTELKKRGISLELSYEDVPLPGKAAATAIKKLIEVNKIHGLAANFWNPAIPVMAPSIMRAEIPAFHTAAADDLILDAGDYIFSTNTKIKDESIAMARYAYEELGARTASVLYISTTFGENYSTHFAKHFETLGGKILYNDLTLLGDTDLRAVLSDVKRKKADVFFAAYFGTNLGIVLKQAKQLGIKSPILSVYEAEDTSVIKTAHEHANGLRYFISEPREETKKLSEVKGGFKERFGYAPAIFARNAYDATMLLATALKGCSLEGPCAKDQIYKTSQYPGFSGTLSIDSEGAANKEFVLKTIKEQQFVRAEQKGRY